MFTEKELKALVPALTVAIEVWDGKGLDNNVREAVVLRNKIVTLLWAKEDRAAAQALINKTGG